MIFDDEIMFFVIVYIVCHDKVSSETDHDATEYPRALLAHQ